jgi:hypothetical protein
MFYRPTAANDDTYKFKNQLIYFRPYVSRSRTDPQVP